MLRAVRRPQRVLFASQPLLLAETSSAWPRGLRPGVASAQRMLDVHAVLPAAEAAAPLTTAPLERASAWRPVLVVRVVALACLQASVRRAVMEEGSLPLLRWQTRTCTCGGGGGGGGGGGSHLFSSLADSRSCHERRRCVRARGRAKGASWGFVFCLLVLAQTAATFTRLCPMPVSLWLVVGWRRCRSSASSIACRSLINTTRARTHISSVRKCGRLRAATWREPLGRKE